MTNKRRVTIITIAVMFGSLLSFLVFKLRRGGNELTDHDISMLITNFSFSIVILLGVGYFFLWKNKE